MKKSFRIALIAFGSIVVLLLASLLLVSPMMRHYLEEHDKELVGRELSIEKLRMNVLLGTVHVSGLTIYEDDAKTPFVTMEHFESKVKLGDLMHRRLWVKKALVSGLKVNVEQNREWFNFSSIVSFLASDDDAEGKEPFGLVLNDITIERSSLHYSDLDIGSEFNLRDIAIRIPSVDLSDLKTDVGLDLCLADSMTLHTDLCLAENAREFLVVLKINNLGLDIIEPYLKQLMPIDSVAGCLSIDITAEGLTEHVLDFDLKGDVAISNLSMQDTLGNILGHIDTIRAQIRRFNIEQNILELGSLRLSGMTTSYVINADSTSNFGWLLRHEAPQDTSFVAETIVEETTHIEPASEKETFSVIIDELKSDKMKLVYQDHTLPNGFRYELSDVSIVSKGFALSGNNTIRLEALLNKTGRLKAQWHGNFNGIENHNLTLMLSNVKVADISPYALRLFGYPIHNGTVSFQSQNKIVDGNITGINKLQLASPEIGNKAKEIKPLYDIPLKTGIYLLTDKRKNVSIDLPVSGNLNDPQFSYRKAIMKVFGNLLVKMVTSPFRLLASDNGIQYIPFNPLHPDFSAEEYAMIDEVAATLHSQPNLSIVFEEQVNYVEMVRQLCNLHLQRDYYLSEHPETDLTGIDFLTDQAIRSIKLNDKGLCDFAVQFSGRNKLHSKKDVTSVAYDLYHEKAETLLIKLMEQRNMLLTDYLIHSKGLSEERFSVTSIEGKRLESFHKPSRYELQMIVYEELEEML